MSDLRNVLILVETSREYGRGLLRGIAQYANIFGPWNIYREPEFYLKPTKAKQDDFLSFKERHYDGIIMRETPWYKNLLELGIPVIIVHYLEEKCDTSYITVDYKKIGKLAAEHFLERGFKNFAYCGFDFMFWSKRRGKSFEKNVKKAGRQVNFYESPQKKLIPWKNEKPVVSEWLQKLPKPVAVFTCNDDRGEQVIDACKSVDVRVPGEVAVLGVDNDEFVCNLTTPPLSSVVLNSEKGGYDAAKALNELMDTEGEAEQKAITISPLHVATRQSTDLLAICDPEVARAISFIRENAHRPIQVNDVVAETSLSRCCLYLRFQKALGCSAYDEIKRVRIERIAKLLLSTDMSILQIALQMGFSDANHIARYFKKEKGITPLAYRRQYVSRK